MGRSQITETVEFPFRAWVCVRMEECGGFCCHASNYKITFHDWATLYVTNVVLALGLLVSVLVMLYKLHWKYHAYVSAVSSLRFSSISRRDIGLPVYYSLAHFAALVLLAEVVVLLTVPDATKGGRVLTNLLFALQAGFLDNVVVCFLAMKTAGKRAIRYSLLISFLVAVLYAVLLEVLDSGRQTCGFCNAFAPIHQIGWMYLGFCLLYTILMVIHYNHWFGFHGRPSLSRWCWFLLFAYSFGALGILLHVYFRFVIAYCMFSFSTLWYSFGWAYTYYRVAQEDSAYCRKFDLITDQTGLEPLLQQGVHADTSLKRIPWRELDIRQRVGLGGYGEVYAATWKGIPVAVKKLLVVAGQASTAEQLREFMSEVEILHVVRHPNVVLLIGLSIDDNVPPVPCIVTEFLPCGSVFDLLHKGRGRPLTLLQKLKIAHDTACGMAYLHSFDPAIIHRDLKSANLLLNANMHIKITDFGLSRCMNSLQTMSKVGTVQWCAPEVLKEERYDAKCDVYSFGVILWELMSEKIPYDGIGPILVMHRVAFLNYREPVPFDCPQHVASLITACWDEDPQQRPSFEEIAATLERELEAMTPPQAPQEG